MRHRFPLFALVVLAAPAATAQVFHVYPQPGRDRYDVQRQDCAGDDCDYVATLTDDVDGDGTPDLLIRLRDEEDAVRGAAPGLVPERVVVYARPWGFPHEVDARALRPEVGRLTRAVPDRGAHDPAAYDASDPRARGIPGAEPGRDGRTGRALLAPPLGAVAVA
ncbi:MAG TPA: hypothetical protein VGB53_02445, partial [Rubricoccaceae bacterium]